MSLSMFAQLHPVIWSTIVSFATGIAASIAYQLMATILWKCRLRRRLQQFSGDYDEFLRLPGKPPMPTRVTVKLSYVSSAKFTTQAFDRSGARSWRGEMFMKAEAPVIGEGFYSHDGRDDTGVHSVLYNPEANHFNVTGSNTSHPDGVKEFKTIWKRRSS